MSVAAIRTMYRLVLEKPGRYASDEAIEELRAHVAELDAAAGIPSWESLTNEQRLAFLDAHPCCTHCGSLNTHCQCDNDE